MVAISQPGVHFGAPFIGYDVGPKYPPHYILNSGGATISVAATDIYYSPFYVAEAVTFAAMGTINSGSGDNGDTYRLAIYANDGTAGPGTLIQDVGQVTLTGAAAERLISTTINLTAYANRWVWLMIHHNQACDMENMTVGPGAAYDAPNIAAGFGSFGALTTNGLHLQATRYVQSAYGAAAGTAVTPTSSIAGSPLIYFKK